MVLQALFFYIWRVNWRWYIAAFTITLTFFGVSLEHATAPNQEIVLQFDANSISADEAQQTISNITDQLKSLGVAAIRVSEMQDGKLKVTYYSTLDVAVIEALFQTQNELQIGYDAFNDKDNSSKNPFNNDVTTYKLEVVKIQKDYGSDIGLHGLLVEIKSAKDLYLNQFVSFATAETNFGLKPVVERKIGENNRNVSLPKTKTSYEIPEVRAGPVS